MQVEGCTRLKVMRLRGCVVQVGDSVSVWSIDKHPEWACRWHFNAVGGSAMEGFGCDQIPFTLSPVNKVRRVIVGLLACRR